MRALKALVIGMAVLIAAGLGVVVVTIVNRSGEWTSPSTGRDAGFGETRVAVPPGSRVAESIVDGDRMVLRLTLVDGTTRLVVLDLATGRELGAIGLVEGNGPPARP